MVATFLQDDLVEELKQIFKNFRLKNPDGALSEINVFSQELPIQPPTNPPAESVDPALLEEGLADTDPVRGEDPYPYAIVRIGDGEIKNIDGDQAVTVLIILGVFDDALENQGHKDILNMVDKITERFRKNAILSKKYECLHPIQWTLQEEQSYPYYIGGIALTFNTLQVRREDPYV